jgi:hypothetical protein
VSIAAFGIGTIGIQSVNSRNLLSRERLRGMTTSQDHETGVEYSDCGFQD